MSQPICPAPNEGTQFFQEQPQRHLQQLQRQQQQRLNMHMGGPPAHDNVTHNGIFQQQQHQAQLEQLSQQLGSLRSVGVAALPNHKP